MEQFFVISLQNDSELLESAVDMDVFVQGLLFRATYINLTSRSPL